MRLASGELGLVGSAAGLALSRKKHDDENWTFGTPVGPESRFRLLESEGKKRKRFRCFLTHHNSNLKISRVHISEGPVFLNLGEILEF